MAFGSIFRIRSVNIGLVVKRNGIDHAVYVGDIQGDYRASKEAGVDFVHAAYGFGRIHEKVPAVTALEELPKMLEMIFSE